MVSTIAICAGSGGGMLLGVDADVYFTGEMSHHEVLAAVQSGHNVILCKFFTLALVLSDHSYAYRRAYEH